MTKPKHVMRPRKLSPDLAKIYKWLVSYICKHEGKRSEVKRGDVMEILGILADLSREKYFMRNTYDLYGVRLEELFSELGEVREARQSKSKAGR